MSRNTRLGLEGVDDGGPTQRAERVDSAFPAFLRKQPLGTLSALHGQLMQLQTQQPTAQGDLLALHPIQSLPRGYVFQIHSIGPWVHLGRVAGRPSLASFL
jgi:hypothetical protein